MSQLDDEQLRALFRRQLDASPTPANTRAKRRVLAEVVGTDEPQKIADRYVLGPRLGAGGMGVVHEGRDTTLRRAVAIKRVRSVSSAGAVQKLESEAHTLAALHHPNIVTVHDVVTHDGEVFVVMERVLGSSLGQWLRRTPRKVAEVLAIFEQAAKGLAAAHEAGIIHRDFKPNNVMVGTDGTVKVIDFGLARATTSATSTRTTGGGSSSPTDPQWTRGPGTRGYIAPEQREGGTVEASDQFALCVSIVEALTGTRPFANEDCTGADDPATKNAIARTLRAAGLPRAQRSAVIRGLATQPSERFASINDLLAALRLRPRRRWAFAVGGALAVGGVLTGLAVADSRADDCPLLRTVEDTWSESRRRALHDDLRRLYDDTTAQRFDTELEGYLGQWKQEAAALCAAEPSTETDLAEARLCLGFAVGRVEVFATSLGDHTPPPSDPVARLHTLAAAECDDGQWAELGASPSMFVQLDPSLERQVHTVFVQALEGNVSGQIRTLTELLDARPEGTTGAWLRLRLAHAYNINGEPQRAAQIAEHALASAAGLSEPRLRAAIEVEAAAAISQIPGREVEAVSLAQRALAVIDDGPTDRTETIAALGALALASLQSGEAQAAHDAADRALAVIASRTATSGPMAAYRAQLDAHAQWSLLHLRGQAKQDLGDPSGALVDVGRALTLIEQTAPRHPDRARILNTLGSVQGRLGHHDAAADSLTKALTLKRAAGRHDSAAMTAMTLGNLHLRRGDRKAAIESYGSARSLLSATAPPSFQAELSYNHAIALQLDGQQRQAAAAYTSALEILSTTPAAQIAVRYGAKLGRGLAHLQLGETALAARDLREARQLEPDNTAVTDALDLRLALLLTRDDPEVAAEITAEITQVVARHEAKATSATLERWRPRFDASTAPWPLTINPPR